MTRVDGPPGLVLWPREALVLSTLMACGSIPYEYVPAEDLCARANALGAPCDPATEECFRVYCLDEWGGAECLSPGPTAVVTAESLRDLKLWCDGLEEDAGFVGLECLPEDGMEAAEVYCALAR